MAGLVASASVKPTNSQLPDARSVLRERQKVYSRPAHPTAKSTSFAAEAVVEEVLESGDEEEEAAGRWKRVAAAAGAAADGDGRVRWQGYVATNDKDRPYRRYYIKLPIPAARGG